MEEYEELDEEARGLEKQIDELWAKRDAIRKEADRQYMKYAKKDVGRCFKTKDNEEYVKIIGAPQPHKYSLRYELDRYEYPAFFVYDYSSEGYEGLPFDFGTIKVQEYSGDLYTEISKAEFDRNFWETVDLVTEDADICDEEDE